MQLRRLQNQDKAIISQEGGSNCRPLLLEQQLQQLAHRGADWHQLRPVARGRAEAHEQLHLTRRRRLQGDAGPSVGAGAALGLVHLRGNSW